MIQALSISDTSKISCLLVPGQYRSTPNPSSRIPTHLELGIPSISFSNPPSIKNIVPPSPVIDSLSVPPSILLKTDNSPFVYGWHIPLGYIISSLLISLCNIIAPTWIYNCAFLVCPIWSISLGLHALLQQGVFVWYSIVLLLLYPFIVFRQEVFLLNIYIILFSIFSTWKFWNHRQGPYFILICVCWVGIMTGCIWTIFSVDPKPQLTVAGFCSVISATLCIRKTNKLIIRVST